MPQDPLVIEDIAGPKEGQRTLRLTGPLTMSTLFDFQSRVRTDTSRVLLLDFSNVPYVDSAGIGALVGAYVTHQKDGVRLFLIGVNERVLNALKVTRVEQFFKFVDSMAAAEQAISA
ncbi:MAG: STAS domain-containing protein [Terriglobales bacterium]